MGLEAIMRGLVSRVIPQPQPDTDLATLRSGRYGEGYALSIIPTKHLLADEGSYYVATSPTPGTGVAEQAVSTAFSDTRGFIIIGNTDQPANIAAKRIYLDYIRLILLGTAPATTVSLQFAIKRSSTSYQSRESVTANQKVVNTPIQMASASGRVSVARITTWAAAAAMTIPASAPNDPVVCRASIPTSLGIAGDEYVLKFGGEDMAAYQGLTAVRATAPGRLVTQCPPIVIEPNECISIHRWWLSESTNPPTFEYELGYFER